MQYDFAQKIFETENDINLLSYVTKEGIPVWMIARYHLMYEVLSSRVLNYRQTKRYRHSSLKMIPFLIKSFFKGLGSEKIRKDKQILLYSTNRKTIEDGKYVNRYIDQLAFCFPDISFEIEQAMIDWQWPFPREFDSAYLDVIARVKSELFSCLFYKRYYKAVSEMVDYYLDRVKSIFGIVLEASEIKNIKKHISKLVYISIYMAKWLKKQLTPAVKAVIMVGAGFPYNYPINLMLKQNNVKSIELQHGFVTNTNIMYNYADVMKDSDIVKLGLSDAFLTYGNWWNEQVNCPMNKVPIGNPYREKCLSRLDPDSKKGSSIVVLGNSHDTESYIELVAFLTKQYGDVIKFRPHPGERCRAIEIAKELGVDIKFDDNIEIYKTLNEATVIISEVTTVLFEAIGLVDKILVWNTDFSKTFMPEHPFDTFDNNDELIFKIEGVTKNDIDPTGFWADNWEKRYKLFIHEIIGIE